MHQYVLMLAACKSGLRHRWHTSAVDGFAICGHGSFFNSLGERGMAMAGAPNVLCGGAILHSKNTLMDELTCNAIELLGNETG